jgi:hypothetical protein
MLVLFMMYEGSVSAAIAFRVHGGGVPDYFVHGRIYRAGLPEIAVLLLLHICDIRAFDIGTATGDAGLQQASPAFISENPTGYNLD